jgi:SAM-dependent methyltransferase
MSRRRRHALRDRLGALRRRYRCPVCRSRFDSYRPHRGRVGAKCPECGSLERHRHLWLFLERETDLFSRSGRLLHIAPEGSLGPRLSALPQIEYVGGDLNPSKPGNRRVDVTNIDFPDDYFDAILCYHVLEHVPEDRLAMRELLRVLRPGGWGILQVPVEGARTIEDPTVTDPEERLRRFRQRDHVRLYGRDFYERLAEEGFDVDVVHFRDQIAGRRRKRYGLDYRYRNDTKVQDPAAWLIPVCRKPDRAAVAA